MALDAHSHFMDKILTSLYLRICKFGIHRGRSSLIHRRQEKEGPKPSRDQEIISKKLSDSHEHHNSTGSNPGLLLDFDPSSFGRGDIGGVDDLYNI